MTSYLPPEVIELVQQRLVAAQFSSKNNGTRIKDSAVVKVINRISSQLYLPAFTRTDVKEVRNLRVRLMTLSPELVGSTSTNRQMADMTPIEALHVTLTMVEQKLNNPLFQRTAEERRLSVPPAQGDINTNPRRIEVHNALRLSVGRLMLRDVQDLAVTSLQDLGIEGGAQ